jgi:hypothetical protein
MSTDDVNEFLLSGGMPVLKYETAGTTHTGKIISAEVQQQREIDSGKPKFWEDGSHSCRSRSTCRPTSATPKSRTTTGSALTTSAATS